jgi:hypothetical protein
METLITCGILFTFKSYETLDDSLLIKHLTRPLKNITSGPYGKIEEDLGPPQCK